MSLAAVAIVVASISALFTAANMIVSALTYRRGRPRVYMRSYWNPYGPFSWDPPDYEWDDGEGLFTIHLVNKSQATVKVNGLYAEFDWDRNRLHFLGKARGKAALKIIKGADEREIPPFGGIKWLAQTPNPQGRPRRMDFSRVRLTASLTNGSRVQSKWMTNDFPPRLRLPDPISSDQPQQLSFEDLEEVE
ncbi:MULTISPECIES: hypothetical protein [unclassified Streptomyces]|uniref:hypothetical protein n=1 Tax=unclassified Streptomyces TaxID=2593676 RepID=UPI00236724D2|nr:MULTISPECIES: hypothetical protein [unclassified Streptomyces]MDF3140948.1 hypothetical protein [Streptomyces sp. T21Q-yed]WDF43601.1 hypothetical protein PBV52_45900 [Streptomyces sp. T12]